MAKAKVEYLCSECGHTSTKWLGNCPSCGTWHTFKEVRIEKEKGSASSHKGRVEGLEKVAAPQRLNEITSKNEVRFSSRIAELDRVLGGGFVPGSFVLIGGDPGIGKSTLALQIGKSNPDLKILYCAGEESTGQIKQRADRLGVGSENLFIFMETEIGRLLEETRKLNPDLLIVDSIQTVYRTELQSMAGSVQQVKECAALLQQLAKRQNITVLVIGHVTKEGELAGPRVLEHMVDTVLHFEGDQNLTYRILRSQKNRFGPAQEVGVFEMNEAGLTDVLNPSQLFLSDYDSKVSGNAVVCTMEGSRPLLIEVQALVTPSNYGTPQRTASGFDHRRLSLLLAVLEKRSGYQFSGQDVYLNVAGGIKLDDTAGDLGVISALVSSFLEKPLPGDTVFLGEVGLGAEIRAVPKLNMRLGEIEKMGFRQAFIPQANHNVTTDKLKVTAVRNFNEAIKKALN